MSGLRIFGLASLISLPSFAQNNAAQNAVGSGSLRREAGGHIELQAMRYTYATTTFDRTIAANNENQSYKFKNSLLLTYGPRVSFLGHAKGFVFGLAGDTSRPGEGHLAFGYELIPGLDLGIGTTIALQTFDDLVTGSNQTSDKERTSNQTKIIAGPFVRMTSNVDFALLEVQAEIELGSIKDEVKVADQNSVKTAEVSVVTANIESSLVFPLGRNFTYVTGININYQSLKNKSPLSSTYSAINRSDLTFGLQLASFRYKF